MARNDAKDALAFVPWYWRDYRASKARAVLISDPPALLAYRELLDAMWGEDGCSLPPDDESLCALSGLSSRAWNRVKAKVLSFLPALGDGRRSHPRSRHEWDKATGQRQKSRDGGNIRAENLSPERRSEIAKQAADARWASKAQASDASPMLADACPPSPSPSPSPKEPEREASPPPKVRAVSEQERISRLLATTIGSSVNPCRAQVAALVKAGKPLPDIEAAVVKFGEPGLKPWDWTKLANGTKPPSMFGYGNAYGPPPPSAEGVSYVPPILKGRP